jgi:hypothetical protein
MKTSVWGPSAWRFLHAVSFAYPDSPDEQQRQAAKDLFQSLRQLIPCGDCCGHYCTEIQSHPPQVQSRDALSRWLVDLHNRVNVRLGKPLHSYQAARAEYMSEESQCMLPSEPCGDAPRRLARQRGLSSLAVLVIALLIVVALAFMLTRH